MNRKVLLIAAGFVCLAFLPAQAQDISKSTMDDQKSVEVTVYNSSIGLIKDVRSVTLPSGQGELRFMDVAAYIRPETVHVKAVNHPDKFMVLEQNYEYDLMDYGKLLDKYVGKKIKIQKENQYQDTTKTVDAELLSNNNGQPVYKIDNEIYLGYGGLTVLPEIPGNLIAKPTLMWMYAYDASDSAEIEVSYLTDNITWKADYVLSLNADDTKGSLLGWVTVDNKSGTDYQDAKLKLVAGDVNRVQPQLNNRFTESEKMMDVAGSAPQFVEQGFFEYHIYDLQRQTTLKDKQIKQINFMTAEDFAVKKEYRTSGQAYYYTQQYYSDNPKQPVEVKIKFKNSEENNLGMPLPKGVIRLYKEDQKGSLQFVGEDAIEHTPKDEEVALKVGEAFDVVAERKQTSFTRVTTRINESDWEITLRNHKKEDIVVSVIEPMPVDQWSVVTSSHTYKKENAFTLRFDVPVKKDEEVKLTYRVRSGI